MVSHPVKYPPINGDQTVSFLCNLNFIIELGNATLYFKESSVTLSNSVDSLVSCWRDQWAPVETTEIPVQPVPLTLAVL